MIRLKRNAGARRSAGRSASSFSIPSRPIDVSAYLNLLRIDGNIIVGAKCSDTSPKAYTNACRRDQNWFLMRTTLMRARTNSHRFSSIRDVLLPR
jgi:hypothetical protein